MVFEPAALLDVAERLLEIPSVNEAAARTAINRSYYACHLTARDQLYGVDAVRDAPRRPSHLAVVQAVSQQLAAKRVDELRRLKRMREIADYVRDSEHPEARSVFADARVTDWPELAARAMAIARDLLPLLQVLPAERTQDA